MQVSIGDRWKGVIAQAVESGTSTSAEDVVTEAMRLFAWEQERCLALNESVTESLAGPRVLTPAEVDAALASKAARLRAGGIPG
jgi:hypothetical protein